MRLLRVVSVLLLLGASDALAQIGSQFVAGGFTAPVAVVSDPTEVGRYFVVEQGGRIRVVRNGVVQPADFLDLTAVVLDGGERGLLGMALAPDYASSGRFFINYTREPDGHTVIARYRRSADPNRADPASGFNLRWPNENDFITQPFANHNGGDLQFGSDGFLYIPLGDGGAGNDPDHRAQNPASLLGKVLRINVNVSDADAEGYDIPPNNPFAGRPDVLHEIWAFGLRNPFRFTVDHIARGGTGALVIADVGQNAWEEINYEPFGAAGRNYGWRNREGAHPNVETLPSAYTPLIDPFHEYSHAEGNVITGGVVYRGTGLDVGFWGRYFYADFGARRVWSVGISLDGAGEAHAGNVIEHTGALGGSDTIGNVSGFAVGHDCEVLFLNWSSGELRRIVGTTGAPPGCPTSPDPFLAQGGGVFVDGRWVLRSHPDAAGAGLGGASGDAAGCTTAQPVSGWLCVNGGWVPPDHPLAGGAPTAPPPPTPPSPPPAAPGPTTCTTIQPVSTWVCVNGGWLPPDHPLAAGAPAPTPPPPPPPPPPSSGGCTTPDPFAGIPGLTGVCVGGSWIPSNHPLAGGGG
jgi:glucose/arabinose dehydrogenase